MGRPSIWDYTDEQLAAMPEQEFMALDMRIDPLAATYLEAKATRLKVEGNKDSKLRAGKQSQQEPDERA